MKSLVAILLCLAAPGMAWAISSEVEQVDTVPYGACNLTSDPLRILNTSGTAFACFDFPEPSEGGPGDKWGAAAPVIRPEDCPPSEPGCSGGCSGFDNELDTGCWKWALNQANVDWRSSEINVEPGEELEFSFDFKFLNVPDGSGFRADARFFTGSQDAGGTFAGETVNFVDAADYAAGEWHSYTTTVVVPAGAPIGDVRLSTYFGQFAGGQALIDNVRLLRATIPGDFNADGEVTGADLQKWKLDFGVGAGSDADGDGDTDGADYMVW